MKALILAAGFGTRMHPFTNTMPKALVPVNGVPLIFYTLALLKKHNITNIVINLHHHGQKIKKLLGNGKKLGLKITYSTEPVILGTGGGIKKAMPLLDDTTLIINGDLLITENLKSILKQHKKHNPLATLCLYKHPQAKKYGLLHFNKNHITSILNEPKANTNHDKAMFAGIYVLNKTKAKPLFKNFEPQKMFCVVRHIFMPYLKNNGIIAASLIKGPWKVCDTLIDVEKVEKTLNNKTLKIPQAKLAKGLFYLVS